jgi:hypothetical protein
MQRRRALTEPIVVMFLLTLLFFAPILPYFTQYVVSSNTGDVAQSYYFLRDFGFSQLRHGIIPLWNPYLLCGTPFIGDLQSAIFYPLNFMFLILPVGEAANVNIILHTFLSGLFFYLMLRELRLKKFASGLASVAFMFSTATLNRIVAGHLTDLNVLVWLPVLLLVLVRMERDQSIVWMLVGALAYACMILAGHPQFVFYFSIYLGLYAGYRFLRLLWVKDWKRSVRFAAMVAGALVAGVLLSAIQMLPALEFGKESFRAKMLSYMFCTIFSFPPENLITFIFPGFFGSGYTENYWGRYYAWEMVAYIGILPLVFALAGLLVSRRRDRFFFAGAAILTTILALGSNTPLFKVLYTYVPGFNLFRGNSKFIVATVFSLCILAGIGFEEVLERELSPREIMRLRWLGLGLIAFAGVCVLLVVILSSGAGRAGSVWERFLLYRSSLGEFYLEVPDFGAEKVRKELWLQTSSDITRGIGLLLLSGLVLLLLVRKPAMRNLLKILVAIAVIMNLGLFWQQRMVVFNKKTIQLPSTITSVLKKDRVPHRMSAPPLRMLNFAMKYNVSTVYGNLSNHLSRYHRFTEVAAGAGAVRWGLVLTAMLDSRLSKMLDVRYYLVREKQKVNIEGARLVAEQDGLALYRTDAVMPRAYVAPEMRFAHDEEEAYKRISSRGFAPERETVVEVPPGFPAEEYEAFETTGTARLMNWNVNGETIDAEASGKCFLVVSEVYAQGWKCSVDGKKTNIYPANYILLGIPLDAGEHRITLRYLPDGYVRGKYVTLTMIVVMIAAGLYLIVRSWRTKKPTQGQS